MFAKKISFTHYLSFWHAKVQELGSADDLETALYTQTALSLEIEYQIQSVGSKDIYQSVTCSAEPLPTKSYGWDNCKW